MGKTPLTKEFLDNFGPGDQFHIVFPETGGRIVADVTAIKLKPRENDNQELYVEFENAIEFLDGGGVKPQPDLDWYDGPVLADLFIAREEPGYAEIPNIGAEQVLMFVKKNHRTFLRRVAAAIPEI